MNEGHFSFTSVGVLGLVWALCAVVFLSIIWRNVLAKRPDGRNPKIRVAVAILETLAVVASVAILVWLKSGSE